MDAVFSRFITGSRDNAPLARMSYGKRLSPIIRVVALLDRGIKSVHIHMDDFAHIPYTFAYPIVNQIAS